jgi:hypothetical protein
MTSLAEVMAGGAVSQPLASGSTAAPKEQK